MISLFLSLSLLSSVFFHTRSRVIITRVIILSRPAGERISALFRRQHLDDFRLDDTYLQYSYKRRTSRFVYHFFCFLSSVFTWNRIRDFIGHLALSVCSSGDTINIMFVFRSRWPLLLLVFHVAASYDYTVDYLTVPVSRNDTHRRIRFLPFWTDSLVRFWSRNGFCFIYLSNVVGSTVFPSYPSVLKTDLNSASSVFRAVHFRISFLNFRKCLKICALKKKKKPKLKQTHRRISRWIQICFQISYRFTTSNYFTLNAGPKCHLARLSPFPPPPALCKSLSRFHTNR